jgi:hypothetical protein
VGFGMTDCRISTGDDFFINSTLDEAADATCLDIHRLFKGTSEHSKHAAFLMASFSCMHADFSAELILRRLTKYFCAKQLYR